MIASDKTIERRTLRLINNDKNISNQEKKRRIKVLNKILKEKNREKRYSLLYDMICDYLDNEFINKNVCGFCDNLCSRRRSMIEKGIKKDTYLNGCCHSYKENADCHYLKNGRCSIKNIACKIYTCPYLKLQGKRYNINKIYFAKYFFNLRQKFYMQNTYFVDKDIVLKGILERM